MYYSMSSIGPSGRPQRNLPIIKPKPKPKDDDGVEAVTPKVPQEATPGKLNKQTEITSSNADSQGGLGDERSDSEHRRARHIAEYLSKQKPPAKPMLTEAEKKQRAKEANKAYENTKKQIDNNDDNPTLDIQA